MRILRKFRRKKQHILTKSAAALESGLKFAAYNQPRPNREGQEGDDVFPAQGAEKDGRRGMSGCTGAGDAAQARRGRRICAP